MRDELPSSFVRLLAYLGAVALPSLAAAQVSQWPKVMSAITPVHDAEWMEVERLLPAFVLSILEAADMPASYAIRRHAEGSRRNPILAATPKYHLLWKAGANRPEPHRALSGISALHHRWNPVSRAWRSAEFPRMRHDDD